MDVGKNSDSKRPFSAIMNTYLFRRQFCDRWAWSLDSEHFILSHDKVIGAQAVTSLLSYICIIAVSDLILVSRVNQP